MKHRSSFFVVIFGVGLLGGLLGSLLFSQFDQPSQEDLIASFYETETAVLVSPHHLRKEFSKPERDFILVDLRSAEEYQNAHVIEAVNIPAYKDPDTSAYGDVERIVDSFTTLRDEHPDKEIIVYCYSIPCMTGRKVGKMLAEHEVYVKELGVGWNEWRYYWKLWNHELEWDHTDVQDYIISGEEPGVFSGIVESTACPIENELGC